MDMEMDTRRELHELCLELFDYQPIDADSIPQIDLYMDQVTTFIESRLSKLKRKDEDKMLTKTMINNYTKEGILFPTKLKKYTNEHMKMLVLIYYLKQVISITDIKSILKPISDRAKQDQTQDEAVFKKGYDAFIGLEIAERENFAQSFQKTVDNVFARVDTMKRDDRILLLIIDLVLQAHVRKTMAEKLIDTYFKQQEEE